MHRISFATLFASSVAIVSLGCAGATDGATASASDVATQAAELESAQCSLQQVAAAADGCRTTFESCISADGADPQACRAQLESCLPVPPPGVGAGPRGPHGGGPDGDGDGPRGPRGPRPEGPPPGAPPSLDGGAPPPPPPGAGPGEGPGGGHGPRPPLAGDGGRPEGPEGRGRGGPGGHGPHPEPAAVRVCHDTLRACIEGGGDKVTCFEEAHQCVRQAFEAAFVAACTDVKAKCDAGEAPAGVCAKATARCDGGIAPPEGAPTAPQCAVPAAN